MSIKRTKLLAVMVAAVAAVGGGVAAVGQDDPDTARASGAPGAEVRDARRQLDRLLRGNREVQRNLKTFDALDFDVFSNQKWDRLKESHAEDVRVYWPDGHMTRGIARHTEDLKALFVHAPDTRIREHPIGFGAGNRTAVTGVFEGTFTKPMPDGKGGVVQPTGKAFKMPMATVGIWKDGVMVEEHLFWDNATYAEQIGIAP